MFVHRSNRTEKLADALAEVVTRPLASPLSEEVIVVASQGLERWLAQELALRLGVWANARFPFPRSFVDELLSLDATATGDPASYRRENLVWSISALLPAVAGRPGAESLRVYLDGDTLGLRRFGLARKLARVFDQYPVYRPELVAAWERGAGRGFQPELWRELVARHGPVHVGARTASFLERTVPEAAPERISIFGVSTLPPIYLSTFSHLARAREVHFFLLSPSPIGGEKHPLSNSLGHVGREFEERLRAANPNAAFYDAFVESGADTALAALQTDLLAGKVRAASGRERRSRKSESPDSSIGIHSCHSPIREVEVLRDQLLAAFDADPTLEPHDVIAMAPNIDAYAPLIEAVFAHDPVEPGFIPYRISDRSTRVQNQTAQALVRLLGLAKSRMKASEVLDLLQLEPVRRRFGIESEELPEVRRLVRESGVRWGIDAAHRASFGQPEDSGNTWAFGLARLLLGRAMTDSQDALFAGVLPASSAGGDAADLVGKLSEYANSLFREAQGLKEPRTVGDWAAALNGALARLVSTDDAHTPELRSTMRAIDALVARAADGGYTGEVHGEALTLLLEEELDVERVSRSFATGGVTFSALLPMRSVPFRVVALLGLSDEDFPRKDRSPGFDLIARKPEPGDRSVRGEDRQLFLEALLSARDRFIVTYVGRAVHDNSPFPPSVVVAELVDALAATRAQSTAPERTARKTPDGQLAFAFAERGAPAVESVGLVVEHPLQPWSPRYFGADSDPRLFGYVEADAAGARSLSAREPAAPRFHAAPLIGVADAVVTVDELARFLENPARALLQRRLGVNLDEEVLVVEDHDPIEAGPLGAYAIGARLLAKSERGAPIEDALRWARATGLVPAGTPGDVDLAPVLERAESLSAMVRDWRAGSKPAPVEVDVAFDKTTLVGVLHDVYPKAQVIGQYARLKPTNEVAAWVRHLALAASVPVPLPTVLIGRPTEGEGADAVRSFDAMDASAAKRRLESLLELYRLGQKAPLCLFSKASRRFAEVWIATGEAGADAERDALEAARHAFSDGRKAPADADDAYVRRLFEGVDPFATSPVPFDDDGSLGLPSFADLSRAVFVPLLAASRVVTP